MRFKFLCILIIAIFIFATGLVFGCFLCYGKNNEMVFVTIDPGETLNSILNKLVLSDTIKSKQLARIYLVLTQTESLLKAGEYIIEPKQSIRAILNKIIKRNAIIHKVTIPEGLTVYQTIRILESTQGLFGRVTVTVCEGELYPSTYYFKHGDSVNSIVEAMRNEFSKVANELWQKRDSSITGLIKTIREATILASIIEKETRYDDEKPEIAGVFLNRLRLKMKLQADPTVIYAITNGRADLKRPLQNSDLRMPLPHNTYYVFSLPPTAIASPGKESIRAALHPNQTNNLYFVADKGRHIFSSTLGEHNKVRQQLKQQSSNCLPRQFEAAANNTTSKAFCL